MTTEITEEEMNTMFDYYYGPNGIFSHENEDDNNWEVYND